jgi:hypothetical protein
MSRVNRQGNCPECSSSGTAAVEPRDPHTHDMVQCSDCSSWSARHLRNGSRYPLTNPNDKTSTPTTNSSS